MTGAYEESMKWMRGYGTRLVWNSVTSTLSAPSKRSDAVSDEMTWREGGRGGRASQRRRRGSARALEERPPHLRDEAVQVGVGGALNVEGAAADVVDGLVVEHDGNVGVLEQ